MTDVASVAQGAQLGIEGTPGTAVAADRLLNSISITDGPEGTNDTFRPDGNKYAALTIPGKEWSTFDWTGKSTYCGDVYILSSLIRKVTPSSVGTNGRLWTIAPQNAAEDTHQTYTIEKGGSVRAHKFAYGMFDSLVIDISRDAVDISGSGFGQRITDGITMTASPTAVVLDPVLPRLFDVYLDSTAAGLGTTKLLRNFTAKINLGNLVGTIWPLNSAFTSFTTHVETVPNATVQIFVEHDAAGAAFLDLLRSGATNFLRFKAVGDVIEAGTPPPTSTWQLDLAVKTKTIGKHSDREGVYGWEPTLDIVNDATWGKPFEFQITNTVLTGL
jgi:hypothetical protein